MNSSISSKTSSLSGKGLSPIHPTSTLAHPSNRGYCMYRKAFIYENYSKVNNNQTVVCIKRHIYLKKHGNTPSLPFIAERAGSRRLSVLTAFHNWQFILRNHKLESHLICLRQIAATGFNVSWANTVITRETRRSRQKSSLPANAASGNFHAPNKNPAQQAFPTSVLWFAEVHRTWMH